MSSLEIEEQVITEKHIPVDMEAYIKFKLGLQLSSGQEAENSQPEEEFAEQVRVDFLSTVNPRISPPRRSPLQYVPFLELQIVIKPPSNKPSPNHLIVAI